MARVHIIDLDGRGRDEWRGLVVRQQTDLSIRVIRVGQGDDPAVVHDRLQANNVSVEGLRLRQ